MYECVILGSLLQSHLLRWFQRYCRLYNALWIDGGWQGQRNAGPFVHTGAKLKKFPVTTFFRETTFSTLMCRNDNFLFLYPL